MRYASRTRAKMVVFAAIAVMASYVLYHNERFLIDWSDPLWPHYEALGISLLIHALAGATGLILVPLQFSDSLRARFGKLHRVVGRIYVVAVLIVAPFGAYTGWLDERLGATSRSFTVLLVNVAVLWLTTTGIGFVCALQRRIPQHRQWMTRSYAVALTFFEGRFIPGVFGWDQDPMLVEIVDWTCLALAVLIADVANQIYELQGARIGTVQATRALAAE